jgi:hypothetical protein
MRTLEKIGMVCGISVAIHAGVARGQQVSDTAFSPPVPHPVYKEGAGPLLLLDEAHHNFHTASGRYLTFVTLARRDGYRVEPNRRRFTRASLAKAKILVIANALNARNDRGRWSLPTPSAFDPSEISAVREWVRSGGSLMLISDHMPFPGAAGPLAKEFGVEMINGFALDTTATLNSRNGLITYTRQSGSLSDNPITRGRSDDERVDSVKAFTGQGFRLSGAGSPLMTIASGSVVMLVPQVAWQFSESTPRMPAKGLLQGAVIEFGKGRVAVFGEAAMFSAQVQGPNRMPMGMNDPAAPQNPQFLLNVLHWLSRLL